MNNYAARPTLAISVEWREEVAFELPLECDPGRLHLRQEDYWLTHGTQFCRVTSLLCRGRKTSDTTAFYASNCS